MQVKNGFKKQDKLLKNLRSFDKIEFLSIFLFKHSPLFVTGPQLDLFNDDNADLDQKYLQNNFIYKTYL